MIRNDESEKKVRKNFRLSQRKLDEARKALGTKTETETVEAALDLVTFKREVREGIERMAGTGGVVDIFSEETATAETERERSPAMVRERRPKG